VSDEYERELQKHWQAPGNGRAECIERVLAGQGLVDASQLSYDLEIMHIGVSVQGPESAKSIRELAAGLGHQSLMLERENTQTWAWLGSQRRIRLDELEKHIVSRLSPDVTVGLGEPAEGVVGWRLTHRQANAALSIALRRPQRVTRYVDVGPEVAVLQDEALARSWVERYLLPLDGMSSGGLVARKALRALFAAEHNVSSAAHALGVHRSTVHRWRNEIEERLGCRLSAQQVDIEIALRIEELSRGAVPHSDGAVR
jgi:sugar diacid utilization regulator